MKRMFILLLGIFSVGLGLVATPGVYRKTVTLGWDFPPGLDTNCVVNIYGSTDASLPLTQWAWRTNVPYPQTNVSLPIFPSRQFFVATCSNYWGESDFSNVATTPGLPRSDINLRVTP